MKNGHWDEILSKEFVIGGEKKERKKEKNLSEIDETFTK